MQTIDNARSRFHIMPTTANAAIRIVIADDHPVFREGLVKLLEAKPDLHVVGGACDGADARALGAKLEPDLPLPDRASPRMTGAAGLPRSTDPRTPTAILMGT